METSTRILVVDDFARFRHFVASLLRRQSSLQIIGEASDGVEAVQKAQELQPDLVLLDIGLPKLNGIEAGRQIFVSCPRSRILFISQESSIDVVYAALSTGASGYVFKMDVENELLAAVNAVLRGEDFLGGRFIGQETTELSTLGRNTVGHRHEVGFYSDERVLLDNAVHFLEAALQGGRAVIVVATELHRDAILEKLRKHCDNLDDVIEQGRYAAIDAFTAIETFTSNGSLDSKRFVELFGSAIVTASKAAKCSPPRVAVFGECVGLVYKQGNIELAVEIEALCNQMLQTYALDVLCAYSLDLSLDERETDFFQKICAEHSAVVTQ